MRQKLGQHFLTNGEVLRKIASALEISPNEIIVEIGPGHGELTQFILADINANPGSRLIVIEKDSELASELPATFDSIEIQEGDALDILPRISAELKERGMPYKLAGNIPYYLTGFLFRLIGDLEYKPILSIFTMQKEVADRLVEKPPQANRLSAAIQWWADTKIIGVISRKDFDPVPEVDSATVLLKTKNPGPKKADSARYYSALRAIFQQPRKTISNNLAMATKLDREIVNKRLAGAGIDGGQRPQNLQIEDISAIANIFKLDHEDIP